jgi:hypothetical protein
MALELLRAVEVANGLPATAQLGESLAHVVGRLGLVAEVVPIRALEGFERTALGL